jgi:deoxyadenosine/deoxycytidine kinase
MAAGPVIWVEGIIGAGKTTFTKQLAEELKLRPIFEPVDDNPLLGRFYEDPKKYAFPMQLWLMAKRHAMQQLCAWEARHGEYDGAVIDRGLPGDRVFCKLHVDAGNIEPEFWDVYEYFYDTMSLNLPVPSLLVFLDAEPEVAHERMVGRGRSAEDGVPLDYLIKLRRGYLDLLVEIESHAHSWSRGMQVMRVPWNVDNQDPTPIISEIAHRCRLAQPETTPAR